MSIGSGDITIMKEDCEDKSPGNCCHQNCFDYNGIENGLCGSPTFKVKRIMVYQMKASEENQKKMIMKMNMRNIKKSIENEIKQIEEWSSTTFKEIIFDSNIHSFKGGNSEFDSIVMNRENLIIMIEDDNTNVFGGFINSKITSTYDFFSDEWIGEKIIDQNSFSFILRTNDKGKELLKIETKRDSNDPSFILFGEHSKQLFSFFGNDLVVMKKGSCSSYYSGQLSNQMFNSSKEHTFILKRIQIWQMEGETNKM